MIPSTAAPPLCPSIAPLPVDEAERLLALHRYQLLDSDPEARFDDLTLLAARICGTPIATITLIDAERQWFKSKIGLTACGTSRDVAFCAHAILQAETLVVEDTLSDVRFASHPLVVGEPKIRFYAGAPLITHDGYALGTLCVIDQVPRSVSLEQREALRTLGDQVVAQFELRRSLAEARQTIAALQRAELELSHSQESLRTLNGQLERRVAQRTEALLAATHEAERANCAKSEFLSRTSHELRTPLNAILGFAQLLEMEENLGTEPRESIAHLLGAGHHLLQLINEVLEISHAESGQLAVSLEPVAVQPLIEEALSMVRPLGAAQRVTFRSQSADGGCQVLADVQRLKQVLLNLLSNAIKYNRPDGEVTLECSLSEAPGKPMARLSVHDTGFGIPAEKRGRLFTPFDRLDAESTCANIPGTGLGLALTRRMVELMGGQVGMESVVGEGSTFWVELPLAVSATKPSAPAAQLAEAGPPEAMPSPKKILYLEGAHSSLRLITRMVARRPEIELLSAASSAAGLQMADEHRPDLILLDADRFDLPEEEILPFLRAHPRTSAIPVIMLSADDEPARRDGWLAAGVRACLAKPVELRALLGVLDECFEPSAARASGSRVCTQV